MLSAASTPPVLTGARQLAPPRVRSFARHLDAHALLRTCLLNSPTAILAEQRTWCGYPHRTSTFPHRWPDRCRLERPQETDSPTRPPKLRTRRHAPKETLGDPGSRTK